MYREYRGLLERDRDLELERDLRGERDLLRTGDLERLLGERRSRRSNRRIGSRSRNPTSGRRAEFIPPRFCMAAIHQNINITLG